MSHTVRQFKQLLKMLWAEISCRPAMLVEHRDKDGSLSDCVVYYPKRMDR